MDDYSNWMASLPSELHDIPLNQIAIPGTHNSASAKLSKEKVGPDVPMPIAHLCKILRRESVLYDWTKTQNLTVTEQLVAGIRYLDIQSCFVDDDYYITHGLLSGTVRDFLEEIKLFMNVHPKEIMLLDFNRFHDMPDDQSHTALVKLITQVIGREKMCLYVGVQNVTLSELWKSGQQVLVFYQHPIAEDHPELWPEDSVLAPAIETDKIDTLMKFLQDEVEKRGKPQSKFHVTRGLLTPNFESVLKSVFNSGTMEGLAQKSARHYIDWLMEKKIGPKGLNITAADFCEKENYISVVINLNHLHVATAVDEYQKLAKKAASRNNTDSPDDTD